MRINLNDTISEVPVRNIRKMLRKHHILSVDTIMEDLGIDEDRAIALIGELGSRELIQPHTPTFNHSGTSYWKTTISGNAFAIAKAGKPIRRESAEQIFAKFMDRVREVANNPFIFTK